MLDVFTCRTGRSIDTFCEEMTIHIYQREVLLHHGRLLQHLASQKNTDMDGFLDTVYPFLRESVVSLCYLPLALSY